MVHENLKFATHRWSVVRSKKKSDEAAAGSATRISCSLKSWRKKKGSFLQNQNQGIFKPSLSTPRRHQIRERHLLLRSTNKSYLHDSNFCYLLELTRVWAIYCLLHRFYSTKRAGKNGTGIWGKSWINIKNFKSKEILFLLEQNRCTSGPSYELFRITQYLHLILFHHFL